MIDMVISLIAGIFIGTIAGFALGAYSSSQKCIEECREWLEFGYKAGRNEVHGDE